jgi:hypothetical protein
MPALETVKKIAERLTGWTRPSGAALAELLRERKANTFHFKDDGIIPNHPRWPLIIYRSPIRLPKDLDPAAVFEELFRKNGWGQSWRTGFTTMCTIIPEFTRCSVSPAAPPRCSSAASVDAVSPLELATWRSSLLALDIRLLPQRRTCSLSALIRHRVHTTFVPAVRIIRGL